MSILTIIKTLLNTEGVKADDTTIAQAAAWALGVPHINLSDWQAADLQPILETVNRPNAPAHHRFTPQSLRLDNSFFPTKNAADTEGVKRCLSDLEKAGINWTNLEIYGSAVACSAAFADVPLYDFVKTTVAIAYCRQKNGNQPLYLINGNVSGIQNYIYDIISRQAAKNLKGRSFYVQMLCEAILVQVRDRLDLPEFCTVYASGGGFFLIAPHTEGIAQIQDKINQSLLNIVGTTLPVELSISPAFDSPTEFTKTWKRIFKEGNRNKQRRFNRQITNNYTQFFDAQFGEFGGDTKRDAITNEEIKKGERTKTLFGLEVKIPTYQQIELGRDLKKSDYWTLFPKGKEDNQLFGWDIYYQLTDKKPQNTEGSLFSKKLNLIKDNEPFTFYGGNKFPTQTDDKGEQTPKYFDDLAQGDGFDRLGVLRMDVDDLGKRMETGLGDKACFARVSAFSRHLDYFFKGYLNTLWENLTGGEQGNSYIVYSGGDDLFLVGRWDEITNLGLAIQKEFKNWVCHNPNLTISGGVVFVSGKFPIVQAAELAKNAEKEAKKYQYTEGGVRYEKNAFCFLDKPLNWDNELPLVQELKDNLLTLLQSRHISKSLLDKINAHAAARAQQIKDKKAQRWRWVMAYDFRRYADSLRDRNAQEFVQNLYTQAISDRRIGSSEKINSSYAFIELLQIAARWAEFEYRTESE